MRIERRNQQSRQNSATESVSCLGALFWRDETSDGGDFARDEGQPGPTVRNEENKKKREGTRGFCAALNKTGKCRGRGGGGGRSERAGKR